MYLLTWLTIKPMDHGQNPASSSGCPTYVTKDSNQRQNSSCEIGNWK